MIATIAAPASLLYYHECIYSRRIRYEYKICLFSFFLCIRKTITNIFISSFLGEVKKR